ncbi:hypothetical protein ABH935_003203 [Catenulispora sp. GAS73]|uniref:DUF6879 family protein n=1 Tax=Catenulispora sp. GAS73 TaxID=3156269 RepID=UPI003513D382
MLLAGDEWARYFTSFTRSAFRLETLPVYTMPDEEEEFRGFLAGELPPEGYHYGWLDTVATAAAEGRPVQRVRVLRRPLSDYIRYEFAYGYDYNVPAGEDIRIADITDHDPDFPCEDWWLFDETTVVRMLYRPDGTQIGRELVEDPDLDQYIKWRDLALAASVPYGEYPH